MYYLLLKNNTLAKSKKNLNKVKNQIMRFLRYSNRLMKKNKRNWKEINRRRLEN